MLNPLPDESLVAPPSFEPGGNAVSVDEQLDRSRGHPTGRRRYSMKAPPAVVQSQPPDPGIPEEIEPISLEEDQEAKANRPRNRLLEIEERDLLKHRLQGHVTYHPSCEACRVSKSVNQHRRKKQGEAGVEIVADFAMLEREKVLCLVEGSSGSIGYIHVSSNRDLTVRELLKWCESIGVTGPSTAVILVRADLEPALLSLLKQGIPGKVESVPPQSPEMVGGAERSVRRLKEQWSC